MHRHHPDSRKRKKAALRTKSSGGRFFPFFVFSDAQFSSRTGYSLPFSASTMSIFLFFRETIRLTKSDIPTVSRMLIR